MSVEFKIPSVLIKYQAKNTTAIFGTRMISCSRDGCTKQTTWTQLVHRNLSCGCAAQAQKEVTELREQYETLRQQDEDNDEPNPALQDVSEKLKTAEAQLSDALRNIAVAETAPQSADGEAPPRRSGRRHNEEGRRPLVESANDYDGGDDDDGSVFDETENDTDDSASDEAESEGDDDADDDFEPTIVRRPKSKKQPYVHSTDPDGSACNCLQWVKLIQSSLYCNRIGQELLLCDPGSRTPVAQAFKFQGFWCCLRWLFIEL